MTTPPDWQVRPPRRKPRTLWSDLAGLSRRFRGLPALNKFLVVAIVLIVAIALYSILNRSDDGEDVATQPSLTTRPLPTSTTTTVALPAGDDKTVKAALDGDSFELTDGTKIRLIGIDAPDVETSACFSSDATAYLASMLPADAPVRLSYDEQRTDRFGRTLAYVYRARDGLFINEAAVRDGYAIQQNTAPNIARADDIAAAQNEARNAARGLWTACSTTTTAARPATTSATSPGTTAPQATTTTTVATTTTTSVVTTTTIAVPVVVEGSQCTTPGATAVFSDGGRAVCAPGPLGLTYLWQRG